jgi:hypothetical protein
VIRGISLYHSVHTVQIGKHTHITCGRHQHTLGLQRNTKGLREIVAVTIKITSHLYDHTHAPLCHAQTHKKQWAVIGAIYTAKNDDVVHSNYMQTETPHKA